MVHFVFAIRFVSQGTVLTRYFQHYALVTSTNLLTYFWKASSICIWRVQGQKKFITPINYQNYLQRLVLGGDNVFSEHHIVSLLVEFCIITYLIFESICEHALMAFNSTFSSILNAHYFHLSLLALRWDHVPRSTKALCRIQAPQSYNSRYDLSLGTWSYCNAIDFKSMEPSAGEQNHH